MKFIRTMIVLATTLALLGSVHPVRADHPVGPDYCADTGGYCYEDCRRAPCIAPLIALSTVLLIAIIFVAVQNTGHGHHGHCHD